MNKEKLLKAIDEQINLINPKTGKDIVFGLTIAKDIISKESDDEEIPCSMCGNKTNGYYKIYKNPDGDDRLCEDCQDSQDIIDTENSLRRE